MNGLELNVFSTKRFVKKKGEKEEKKQPPFHYSSVTLPFKQDSPPSFLTTIFIPKLISVQKWT